MDANSRRQPRKVLQDFTFLQMEGDEGGRVLNISEGGLSFEAFSSVSARNPVHLWFSFNLRDRIEATGKVVWTDAGSKLGGLAFTNLSKEAREEIRSRLAELSAVRDAAEKAASNGKRLRAIEKPVSRPVLSEGKVLSLRGTGETSDASAHTQLVPFQRYLSATRSQFVRGLVAGVLLSGVIAIPVFRYVIHSEQSAGSERTPQQIIPSISTPAPESQGEQPVPALQSPVVPPATSKSASPKGASDASRGNAAKQPASSRRNAPTPEQLWDWVQAGDGKAAVALADLYLRGDGVPASCAQAKILLDFAAQKNNAEAKKKARELEKSGCPGR